MRRLSAILVLVGLGLGFTAAPPASAAQHKGRINAPANYFYLATGFEEDHGPLGTTLQAFLKACAADRAAIARGQAPRAISSFLASPLNGYDGYVVDLKKPTMGAFSVKGPGAKAFGPEVSGIQHTEYDMDLDFFVDPAVDPGTASSAGCLDANPIPGGNRAHRCFAHKETPDEKTPCITGYKDSKRKVHGARYVVVNACLNAKGPFDVTVTTP